MGDRDVNNLFQVLKPSILKADVNISGDIYKLKNNATTVAIGIASKSGSSAFLVLQVESEVQKDIHNPLPMLDEITHDIFQEFITLLQDYNYGVKPVSDQQGIHESSIKNEIKSQVKEF